MLAGKCDQGDAPSCAKVGGFYHRGDSGAEKDPARAAEWYEKGCRAPNAGGESCYWLGMLFVDGKHLVKDAARAVRAFERGCEARHVQACYELGHKLANGEGTERDYARASTAYRTSCDGGVAAACNNLAILYGTGQGVEKDDETGAEPLKFVHAHYDGSNETEDMIQKEYKATIRCLPFDGEQDKGTCIFTGKQSARRVVFARAY